MKKLKFLASYSLRFSRSANLKFRGGQPEIAYFDDRPTLGGRKIQTKPPVVLKIGSMGEQSVDIPDMQW